MKQENDNQPQTVKYTAVEKGNRWSVKDIILTVVMSAVAIAIMMVISFGTMFNHVLNLIFTMGIVFFAMSPLFVFTAIKVNKRFVMSVFFGLYIIYSAFSYWYSMIPLLGIMFIIELFMRKKDSYKTPWKVAASYGLMGAASCGTSYFMLLNWGSASETMLAQGISQEYMDNYIAWYTNPGIAIGIFAFTTLAAAAGCLISFAMFKKHFKKTGVL